MNPNHAMLLFAFVAIVGLVGLFMHPGMTGLAAQENMTLLVKISPPCFCESQGNITAQQKAFYSIVESAESAVQRKEISEDFAVKLLNKSAEKTCELCAIVILRQA